MMQYYEMKQCFAACGDEDIPFIEGLYNDERGLTKKIATKHHHYPSFEAAWSNKWQIQRMCLCEGCGKYFKSEDCESISGSGTFNCDECNHPAEPKVLTFEESEAKYWIIPGVLDEKGYWRRGYKTGFGDGDQNGKLAEYQRPEQVELREAIEGVKSFLEAWTNDAPVKRIVDALAKLKPPTDIDIHKRTVPIDPSKDRSGSYH